MLTISAVTAFSALIGALTGPIAPLSVVLVALWGVGLGLISALGVPGTIIGVNAVIALVIFGRPPYGPYDALPQAACVFAGGALQTLLLVLVWPLQRFARERHALAAAYRGLAAYAEHLPVTKLESPQIAPLNALAEAIAGATLFSRRGTLVAFEALLDEATRIRGSLAAIATDRYLLASDGAEVRVQTLRALGERTGTIMREIAAALDAARAPEPLEGVWHAADLDVKALEDLPATRDDAQALLAQLRSAWRAAQAPAGRAAASPIRPAETGPFGLSPLGDMLETVRANLSLHAVYGQHALRSGATLGLAAILEHVLPLQRAYWLPLTAALVLRADFTGTFTRGFGRVAGTVAGAVLASLITTSVHPDRLADLLLVIVFAFLSFALIPVNFALFSTAITCYVVFLLALGGAPEHLAALDRVIATLGGGALAMLAYVVFPTWAREQVPDALAALLDAQRAYATLVLHAYAAPERVDPATIRAAQIAAWRARSGAEAAVEQMLGEPVKPRGISVRAVLAILAATRRFGAALLTLHSRLARPVHAFPPIDSLAGELDHALEQLIAALHGRGAVTSTVSLSSLRSQQVALKSRLDVAPDPDLAALVSETDLLVESVATIADALGRSENTTLVSAI